MWKVTTSRERDHQLDAAHRPDAARAPHRAARTPPRTSPADGHRRPKTISDAVSVGAFTLQSNEHLYVQYWRHQTMGMTQRQTTIATMLVVRRRESSHHASGRERRCPDVPALVSRPTGRGRTTRRRSSRRRTPIRRQHRNAVVPALLRCRLRAPCSRAGRRRPALASGATGTLDADQPRRRHVLLAGPGDRLQPRHHVSGWSGTSSFVVDTVPPGTPTLDSPAAGARVNTTQLGATFVDSDASDSGTVELPALQQRVVLGGRRVRHVGDRRHAEQAVSLQPRAACRRHVLLASPRDRRRRQPDRHPGRRRRASCSTRTRRESEPDEPGRRAYLGAALALKRDASRAATPATAASSTSRSAPTTSAGRSSQSGSVVERARQRRDR